MSRSIRRAVLAAIAATTALTAAGSLALSLFAFNIGVELGQCAIVLLALPMIRYAQRHTFYQRTFMPAAAMLIAAIGVAWSVERGAGISLGL